MDVNPDALQLLVKKTRGYPYFVQEWGKHSWDLASKSPIRRQDVESASVIAIAAERWQSSGQDLWSPSHDDTAFTVPLLDEFMRRIMPGDSWKK